MPERQTGNGSSISDEELQAALAANFAAAAPVVAELKRLTALRNVLYQQHIAPLDEQLNVVKRTARQYDDISQQIEAELRANQQVRAAAKKARLQAEALRLAEERRQAYVSGLQQRLTTSASILEQDPVQLSQGMADVFKRVLAHPRCGEMDTDKIAVRTRDYRSVRIILGAKDPEYFLHSNPNSGSQAGIAVSQVTSEVAWNVDTDVIRNFIGFKVEATTDHPSAQPFVLTRSNGRKLLPVTQGDIRFDSPLAEITDIISKGDITFRTTSQTAKIQR